MSLIVLEIPGVTGECAVKGYENMIICDTFGQDAELEIEPSQNQRRTIHVPKLNNLTFERKFDSASANLLKKMLTGKVDSSPWLLHCLRALGDDETMQKEFLTIKMTLPILAKHTLNVNEGDTTEQFEINAVEITWTYNKSDAEQKQPGAYPFTFNTLKGAIV